MWYELIYMINVIDIVMIILMMIYMVLLNYFVNVYVVYACMSFDICILNFDDELCNIVYCDIVKCDL